MNYKIGIVLFVMFAVSAAPGATAYDRCYQTDSGPDDGGLGPDADPILSPSEAGLHVYVYNIKVGPRVSFHDCPDPIGEEWEDLYYAITGP